MTPHIDQARLKEAAEKKVRLTPHEWQHIEECRPCLNELTEAIRALQTPPAAASAA